jgi:hypothetical protein
MAQTALRCQMDALSSDDGMARSSFGRCQNRERFTGLGFVSRNFCRRGRACR